MRDTLLISGRGDGVGIRLDFLPGGAFDFIQPVLSGEETWYLANCFKCHSRYMLFNQSGQVKLSQEWKVSNSEYCCFDVEAEDGEFPAGDGGNKGHLDKQERKNLI